MKQTAFGYEHENGSIVYTCVKEFTLDELFEHASKRNLPQISTIMNTSLSLEDYFSPEFFEKENTTWRLVFLLDGNTLFRHVSKDGDLLYRIYGN
jgi:hypothetical protein